jgi:hypothetical protein
MLAAGFVRMGVDIWGRVLKENVHHALGVE